jgi:hypothetical protein
MATPAGSRKEAFDADTAKVAQSIRMFGAKKPARRAPSAGARTAPKKPTAKAK